jgi:hypothetical protein
MMLKQKGKFDIADKASVLPKEVEETTTDKKSSSKSSSKSKADKYAEKPNYDVDDNDDDGVSLGFYIFIELILTVYWFISY